MARREVIGPEDALLHLPQAATTARRQRPLRLLLPRCRFCRAYTLSWVHKVFFYAFAIAVIYLLVQIILGFM